MPIYEYECKSCGYKFDALHSMSIQPLTLCPECDQEELMKLISPTVSIIIKGTNNPCVGGRVNNKKHVSTPKPFWRNGSIDKNILKNPKKYIEKGEI